MHTVLADPSSMQRQVITELVAVSSKVVVMAEKAKAQRSFSAAFMACARDRSRSSRMAFRMCRFPRPKLQSAGSASQGPVILTFGLLSPNKGIDVMIDAMPVVLRDAPTAVYVVLGATYPRNQGESYRDRCAQGVCMVSGQ
jgi:glycosyltransferase involved in cell wall biosynthesis